MRLRNAAQQNRPTTKIRSGYASRKPNSSNLDCSFCPVYAARQKKERLASISLQGIEISTFFIISYCVEISSVFSSPIPIMWVVILNAKGQAPYFRGASSLPHLFFIPQTTINRNRNGVKTWREIIGIWILKIGRRSRRGTPAGIARLKSPRGLACIPRRSTTNCNEAIPEKWTRRNARFTAQSGRKRWFGKTSSAEAAAGRHKQTAGAEREVLTVTNFEKLTQSPAGLGAFLRGLPILEGPWDNEFHKRYCRKCPSTDCTYCPHEKFRNNPEWWLNLKAR